MIHLRVVVLAAIAFLLLLWCLPAKAQMYLADSGDGVQIYLFDEPCRLKSEVTNLHKRATWVEKGKTTEGCLGLRPDEGVVLMYFADKTVVVVPMGAFRRVTGV